LNFATSNLKESPIPLALEAADTALGLLVKSSAEPGNLRIVGLVNYAYSNWRSTVILTLIGATHQVPTVSRTTLEALLYAHLFSKEEKWLQCWVNRHASAKEASKFRNEGPKAARAALERRDQRLANEIKELTDFFIDFGGYPNIGAIENLSTYFSNPEDRDGAFVVFAQLENMQKRSETTIFIMQVAGIMFNILKVMWPQKYQLLAIETHEKRFRYLAQVYVEEHRCRFRSSSLNHPASNSAPPLPQ